MCLNLCDSVKPWPSIKRKPRRLTGYMTSLRSCPVRGDFASKSACLSCLHAAQVRAVSQMRWTAAASPCRGRPSWSWATRVAGSGRSCGAPAKTCCASRPRQRGGLGRRGSCRWALTRSTCPWRRASCCTTCSQAALRHTSFQDCGRPQAPGQLHGRVNLLPAAENCASGRRLAHSVGGDGHFAAPPP